MGILDNPFYILKVDCEDNRRKIAAAAEEMGFFLDSDVAANAQNTLISGIKRLSAEMDWFVDSDKTTLKGILNSIDNHQLIELNRLMPLSKLNALLYNFSVQKDDMYEVGYAIIDIDSQFTLLDPASICKTINEKRSIAGMAQTTQNDVLFALNEKRRDIQKEISEKLSALDDNSYVNLINVIADKCIANKNYNDGAILSDLIDQYEVKVQSELEQKKQKIEESIYYIEHVNDDIAIKREDVDNLTNSQKIDAMRLLVEKALLKQSGNSYYKIAVNNLIDELKKWDRLAQPLQLKAMVSGMPHSMTLDLGRKVRDFAVYLNNDVHESDVALILVNAMKGFFAESEELSLKLSEDSDQLKSIIENGNVPEDIPKHLEIIKEQADNIMSVDVSKQGIELIEKRVDSLYDRINALDISNEKKTELLEVVCAIARDIAINLNNIRHESKAAKTIIEFLLAKFNNNPTLSEILQGDLNRLAAITGSVTRSTSGQVNNKSEKKKWYIYVLLAGIIALVIYIFSVIDTANDYSEDETSTPKPTVTATPTPDLEDEYTSIAEIGDKVYADVMDILPKYGVYTEGHTFYDTVICLSTLKNGETAWIAMPIHDYASTFGDTKITSITVNDNFNTVEQKTFDNPIRVSGKVVDPDAIVYGLSDDTSKIIKVS